MRRRSRDLRRAIAALCCTLSLSATAAPAKYAPIKDPLEPARAALRTLQFNKAIELLQSAAHGGNPNAQYLLGLIYLNGVGGAADPARAQALLESAAERGHAAAAFVLAGELARAANSRPDGARKAQEAQQWLERSARAGDVRAIDALKSGRPLLDRDWVGAGDPSLFTAWVIDCSRRNDAAALRRLGPASAAVRDEFGRGPLAYAIAAGAGEAGMRAVALRVNEVVGLAGFVVPGMRVDVLMAGNAPTAEQARYGTLCRTILENIEVLSAGQKLEKTNDGKPETAQVVNLLVTPTQAGI